MAKQAWSKLLVIRSLCHQLGWGKSIEAGRSPCKRQSMLLLCKDKEVMFRDKCLSKGKKR